MNVRRRCALGMFGLAALGLTISMPTGASDWYVKFRDQDGRHEASLSPVNDGFQAVPIDRMDKYGLDGTTRTVTYRLPRGAAITLHNSSFFRDHDDFNLRVGLIIGESGSALPSSPTFSHRSGKPVQICSDGEAHVVRIPADYRIESVQLGHCR